MKGSSFFKASVYLGLLSGIAVQLLALSLCFSATRGWLSPVLFKCSQYYLASLDCQLLAGDFQLEKGKILSLKNAFCYIGKDKAAILCLKQGRLNLVQASLFSPSLKNLDLQLEGLSLDQKSADAGLFVVDKLSLSLQGDRLIIKDGHLSYGPLKLSLGGSTRRESLASLVAPGKNNPSLSLELALKQAERLEEKLTHVREPLGSVYFQEKERGTALYLYLGATLPNAGLFQGILEAEPSKPVQIRFYLPSADCSLPGGSRLSLQSILGAMTTPKLSSIHALRASLSAKNLRLNDCLTFSFLQGELSAKDPGWLHLDLKGAEGKSWAAAKVDVEPKQKKACFSLKGELEDATLHNPFIAAYTPEGSYFRQPAFFDFQGKINEGYTFQELLGSLGGEDLCLLNIPLDSLRAELKLDSKTFSLAKVSFQHKDCKGRGAYHQDLETRDYRFLLKGSLNPHRITPVMDPWWKDLWADFCLPDTWPEADVDVKGNWAQQSTSFVYGYATARNFSFRKAQLDTCSLYFWAAPLYLQLLDMSLEYQDQRANILMDWVYSPKDPDNYYAIAFAAKSSLSLSHLALLLANKDVEDLSNAFCCTFPPNLEGKGILYGEPAAPKEDHLRLHCKASHALSYEGLDLDYLSFNAHKQGPKTEVSSLFFGLAEGKAQGALVFNSCLGPSELSFDFLLEDAKYDALRKLAHYKDHFKASLAAPQLHSASSSDFISKKALDTSPIGGLASLKAKGKGHLGVFNSFRVEGAFRLKEAQLGQIHLLGQLSKSLKLGSFDFKDLKAEFYLDAGFLTVPSLGIWGNTARMEGKGDYSFIQDELDFSLHFYFLGGLKVPVVSRIFRWIDPLSKISFIQLKGSLDEPEWKLKLSPFAFLK